MRNNDPFEELMRSLEENLRRGGEAGPPPPGEPTVRPEVLPPNWRRWLWLIIPLALIVGFTRAVSTLAHWTWMVSVGYGEIFWTRIAAQSALFVGGALLFYLIFAANVVVARQLSPYGLSDSPIRQLLQAFGLRVTPAVMLGGAVAAIFMGLIAAAQWEQVLLYLNPTPFGVADPAFQRDVGFYIFTLPIWEALRGWLMVTLSLTFAAVLLVSGILWQPRDRSRRALVHLAVIAGLMLLLVAWQYQLGIYHLVYSQRGAIYGASYTDMHAVRPANLLMIGLSIAAAVAVVVLAGLKRSLSTIVLVLGVWLVIGVIAAGVYPGIVQRFQVGPNELTLETPYIAANIASTRRAYALDEIEVKSYNARQHLTAQALLTEPETLLNIRLWDYRPLLQTYNQIQALRQYYEFNDIDIDRYMINGQVRQVMLGARELITERLNTDAQTWVNQRLVYTHGFGVAASPVAQVTRDGLPDFYLKDLPPTGVITVTQPQIYFGERTSDYVIGRTDMPEFDYPRADGNVTSSFSAETGIAMTWWHRLLFAVHLGDLNLVLNSDISADSRLLWQRNVADRVRLIAPFLSYDADPYIVVGDDGRLFWIQDAFTTTDRYPYSQPLGSINYIRNSVKVVTSAYDGTMTFYLVDPSDPIVASYARVFPTLFQPMSAMPADLLDNVRYPEDVFAVQAEIFRTYHMTDPVEFYNREDVWAWAEEIAEDQTTRVEPYYVLMQLPGVGTLDYVMILPFTPSNRENMVSWLAVQNDPARYGQKVVFNFGKDSLFFGPKQIEARIDQDPVISAQLTLWNQQGSGVLRGNILIIPIADSLLYVEPLYLQAPTARIPELTRVIAATADSVVMAENLGAALAGLFGRDLANNPILEELGANEIGKSTGEPDTPASGAAAGDQSAATLDELIVQANTLFASAQERLRAGDWAGYGQEIVRLEQVLRSLAAVGGVALPTPAPAPGGEAAPADAQEPPGSSESAPATPAAP